MASRERASLHVTGDGAITFDGRIDNRNDPRFAVRGRAQGEMSDAKLALDVYEQGGIDGFRSLIGDFSLVALDARRRRLMLASDFAGVRPLYYFASGSEILWSSRLKSLMLYAPSGEIDEEYVAGLLVQGGCPNRTPYRGIFSVAPGHVVTASEGGVQARSFWTLPVRDSIRYRRQADYEERLRELFLDAVQSRLRTRAAVLCECSGGLDSSSIVCGVKEIQKKAGSVVPRLVTLSYDRANSRDKIFQDLVESYCGFEKIHLSTAEYAFLDAAHTGGTQPSFWEQMHHAIARAAREQKAGTVMTGLLGDLIMGNWWDDSARVLLALRRGTWAAALRGSLDWGMALGIPIWWVLGRAMMSALPPFVRGTSGEDSSDGPSAPRNREDSIAPGFRSRMGLKERDRFQSQTWREAPPERRKHFRGLAETIELRKLQPPEPFQHLAYTHPYGHRPLVEFMLTIPADIVCGPGEPRRLMRRAFRDLLPAPILHRRSKDSFGGVFLESLRPLAETLLSREPFEVVEQGWVEPVSFRSRLEKIVHAVDSNEPQMRQIMLLEFWLRGRGMRSELKLQRELGGAGASQLVEGREAAGEATGS